MTVKEWLENRKKFTDPKNKAKNNKAAKDAREKYRTAEIDRRTNENAILNGGDYDKARKDAIDSMKGKAALHNPDGVAGGDVSKISGMGDSGVNSSIGSQCKNKVGNLEQKVKDQV